MSKQYDTLLELRDIHNRLCKQDNISSGKENLLKFLLHKGFLNMDLIKKFVEEQNVKN